MGSKLVEAVALDINEKVAAHIQHLSAMAEQGIRGTDYVVQRTAELEELKARAHQQGKLPAELVDAIS